VSDGVSRRTSGVYAREYVSMGGIVREIGWTDSYC